MGYEKTKRERKEPPVPDNYEEHFNKDQLMAWRQLESFGWSIWFIRRPLFQEPTIVLHHANTVDTYILDSTGKVIKPPSNLVIREDSEYSNPSTKEENKERVLINQGEVIKKELFNVYPDWDNIEEIELVPLTPSDGWPHKK